MTDSSSSLVFGFVKVVPHDHTETLVHYSLTTVKQTRKEDMQQHIYCDCFYCIWQTCIWPQTSSTVRINRLYHIRAVLLPLHFKAQTVNQHLLNYSLSGFHPTIQKNNVFCGRTLGHLPFRQTILIIYKSLVF